MHMRAHLFVCANGGQNKMLFCLLCWSYMCVQQNHAWYFYVGVRDWNSEQAVYTEPPPQPTSRVLMVYACECVCARVCTRVHAHKCRLGDQRPIAGVIT